MHRILLLLLFVLPLSLSAQNLQQEGEYGIDWGGYLFGFKGGASLGNQDWTGLETELLLGYHGALFVESVPAQGKFSFYGQLGYHIRGSRISRRRGFTFGGAGVTLPADDFRFQNISLGIGAKQVFGYSRIADFYYLLGVRLDYNVDTNLDEYDQLEGSFGLNFRANYPFESYSFINRFTYGVSAGAGANIPINDAMGGFVEISAHPDLNFQYNQPPIQNVIDPFGAGNRTIGERAIRNFTIEISVGLRFLRKWTYID
ncbi:hypothetical protein [Lewinella sp. W8]|uniref:hypothetical protein n=1 Tax=Lewinella sp. W8 TaxID=2528208 RepID=UPI001068C3BA|nr:hypothetical protein [Lewinella sp. W8]MTB52292.1 hypothetical protein [Lewinella sp. W8]